MTSSVRLMLLILVAGLVIGTATHVENLARVGLVPRPDLPLAYNVFWSALVVVDPAAALVLLLRPRVGVVLVVAIMAVDLTVNISVLGLTRPVAAQIAYALVALASVPIIMTKAPNTNPRKQARKSHDLRADE